MIQSELHSNMQSLLEMASRFRIIGISNIFVETPVVLAVNYVRLISVPALPEWGLELTREANRLGSTTARLKLKGIDGKEHNQGSMWFNSIRSEGPYPDLTCNRTFVRKRMEIRKDDCTAAAWLSSARAVGCRLKCRNERNPYRMFDSHTKLPCL